MLIRWIKQKIKDYKRQQRWEQSLRSFPRTPAVNVTLFSDRKSNQRLTRTVISQAEFDETRRRNENRNR